MTKLNVLLKQRPFMAPFLLTRNPSDIT